MSRYNKLFNWNKYNGFANDDDMTDAMTYDNSSEENDFNNTNNRYILDNVIRHPYMEQLELNVTNSIKNGDRNYLVIYRINTYNIVNHVVEFYIIDDFLSTSMENTLSYNKDETTVTGLATIPGDKRVKGTTMFKDDNYTFIQVRNNKDTSNWLNIWDILVNKHYFGKTIHKNIIDFFKKSSELTNLMLNQTICLKPIVLYSYIDERYHEYIKKNKTIQYCQSKIESLIKLHHFKENDNVRTVCFIEDHDFSNTSDELIRNHYIIKREIHDTQERIEWIFKNDNILFSSVK